MNCIGIVLARLDSRRFPGKALHPFLGRPLIVHVLERASLALGFNQVVLATTDRPVDDPLVTIAAERGFPVFRGDYADVGKRARDCAVFFGASAFARLNGDSPAIDVPLLDAGMCLLREKKANFVTNLLPERSYPYGVAVEIADTAFFSRMCEKPRSHEQQEHLTKVLYDNRDGIALCPLPLCEIPCSRMKLTIDTPMDHGRLEWIYPRIAHRDGSLNYQAVATLPEAEQIE